MLVNLLDLEPFYNTYEFLVDLQLGELFVMLQGRWHATGVTCRKRNFEVEQLMALILHASREGAATVGNSAQAGSSGLNPKMTLLLVFNIFRNSTFYTNVDYVPSFILCNLVVGGSTGILAASWPF